MTVDKIFESACKFADRELSNGHDVISAVYIHLKDGQVLLSKLEHNDPLSVSRLHAQILGLITEVRRQGSFGGAVLVGEAWYVEGPYEQMEEMSKTAPRNSLNRKECLLVVAYASEGVRRVGLFKILGSGKFRAVGKELLWPSQTRMSSWLDVAFASDTRH